MNAAAETIAAVATAPGAAGVGVLRVSGPASGRIARILLGRAPKARHAHYATFRDAAGETIDRGLLLWFPAPASYTGEDVLELQAHGSPVVLRMLLARVLALGARPARPGEFSERAFLNGKLDLAQAEAVADLVASGSEAAARAAQRSLDGVFSREIETITASLVRLRTHVEAAIDFSDEEIDFLAAPAVVDGLAHLQSDLDALLAAARRGVRLAEGLHVVLAGRPNTGKSSLLNALAASERAIVTDIAGTTRDVLRETIDLDGVALTVVDTAGLREAGDAVEREGIRRARGELERADVVLLVTDAPQPEADADLLADLPSDVPRIVVHNKIDLARAPARAERIAGTAHFWLSARHGDGLAELAAELRRLAGAESAGESAFTARARHVVALETARGHLAGAARAALHERMPELAAEELRLAQRALGEITGAFGTEDLLGSIFSSFCIGK